MKRVKEKKKLAKADELEKHKRSWYAIDTETTHGHPGHERLEFIELAIVQIDPLAREFELVYDKKFRATGWFNVSPETFQVVKTRPPPREPYFTCFDAEEIMNIVNGSQGLVAHNLSFDM